MMTMPCCLYAGDADPLYPKVRECAQRIPGAISFAMVGLGGDAGAWEPWVPGRRCVDVKRLVEELRDSLRLG